MLSMALFVLASILICALLWSLKVQASLRSNIQFLQENLDRSRSKLADYETQVDELNYEITDEQYGFMLAKIKSRVRGFCDPTDIYYQTYIVDCHGFLKKNYNEGSKAKCTKKRNYDRVMQGVEAWVPDHEALKTKKDKRDIEKRKHELKITEQAKKEMAVEQ